MQLTEKQSDALTELINIAFSRTAASLSDLTGHRVQLSVPSVALFSIDELTGKLGGFLPREVAAVHQIFNGPLTGDALLLMSYEGASALSSLLTDEQTLPGRLDASSREVLTEVGNILLNACLGTFGNLLQVCVSFSVPRLELETLEALLKSLIIGKEELRYALVVYTSFSLRSSSVGGYMVIVLGVSSLDMLIKEVEVWEASQGEK